MSVIAFHGCSFTWGQGLQYYYLREKLGYTDKQLKLITPGTHNFDFFPKKVDDYRKENHFPNLVASHFDVPYILSLQGNGGDNESIIKRVYNPYSYHKDCVQLHVVQLSSPTRGSDSWTLPYLEKYQDKIVNPMWIIEAQVEMIIDMLEEMSDYNQPILFLCWYKEHAEYIKEHYPDKLIPIHLDGDVYDSFDTFEVDNWDFRGHSLLIQDDFSETNDTHFSKNGHKVISNSIIKKISKDIEFNIINI
jgi:hypothetical protein